MNSSLYESYKTIENNKEVVTMSSLEVVDLINEFRKEEGNRAILKHNDFMKSVRKEVESLENVGISTKGNFHLCSYQAEDGSRNYNMYKLTKPAIMQLKFKGE